MGRILTIIVIALAGASCAEEAKQEVQVKELKKQSALVIKVKAKRADIETELGKILPKIAGHLEAKKIKLQSAPLARYVTSDGQNFEIEAGFIVPDGTEGEGEIVACDLPAGKVAVAVHTGSYESLPKTYDAIAAALATKGVTAKNWSWEVYVSDPKGTKPEELKTEIYVPLDEEKGKE